MNLTNMGQVVKLNSVYFFHPAGIVTYYKSSSGSNLSAVWLLYLDFLSMIDRY